MSNARRFLKDGVMVLVGQGLSRGLGVILLPFLTMVFLPAQFGMSALATSYVSFVSVIALLGLDLTYLQSISGVDKQEAEATERLIWTLTLSFAVCAAVIGSVAWWLWGKQTPESTLWLALGILSTMIFSVCQSQMKVARQYYKLAAALSTGGLVMYSWALVRGYSGHDQAVTLVSGYALGAASAVLVSWPRIRIASFNVISPSVIWSTVKIGLPAAFSAPVFWIISSMDRWLVAQYWGIAEAGIYTVAASISGIGLLFGSVVQTVWMTEASRHFNTTAGDCYSVLAERMKEICFLFALVWLALLMFSGEIIHLFAAPPFDRAIVYLPWLLSSVMLYGLFQAMCVYLIINKSLYKASIIWFCGGLIFIVLSLAVALNGRPSVDIPIVQSVVYLFMCIWLFILLRRQSILQIGFGRDLFLLMFLIGAGLVIAMHQESGFSFLHFSYKVIFFIIVLTLVGWRFKDHLLMLAHSKIHPVTDSER